MANLSVIEKLKKEISDIETGGSVSSSRSEHSRRELDSDAFSKIVALVNVSDRSEKMLRERLSREGFGEEEIDEAINRAKRCGIIDDLRYADVLIRSRLNQGRGAVGIERELGTHGIDVGQVAGWPFAFGIDDESERQRAHAFLEAHPSRSKNRREGAYRKLIQKGYSSAVAASVARMLTESL